MFSGVAGRYLIHTSFNQCSTGTGRLSSSAPNLQSIPTTEGGVVRSIGGGDVDTMLDSLNVRQWFVPVTGSEACLLSS